MTMHRNITILTYDIPHRKTQDLILTLMANGYKNLRVIATPFEDRKQNIPIFKHRPDTVIDVSLTEMCYKLGIDMGVTDSIYDTLSVIGDTTDAILIGGAGILEKRITDEFKIINSHPGYLPNVKGLDAFKWAIYEGQPIGVTTHFISDKVDGGEVIGRNIVPVYFEDTFHSVAQRVYELEIKMLIEAIGCEGEDMSPSDTYEPHRRMPHRLEIIMMERFTRQPGPRE